jgi:hypothetical protein
MDNDTQVNYASKSDPDNSAIHRSWNPSAVGCGTWHRKPWAHFESDTKRDWLLGWVAIVMPEFINKRKQHVSD